MPHLTIDTTTMGFRIGVTARGEIKGTHLSIVPFSKRFQQKQYDRMEGTWSVVNEFFHFDPDKEICYFPRFSLDDFKSFLSSNSVTYTVNEIPPTEGKDASFLMLPFVEYKNDKQKNAVAFLTDEKTGPLRGLALQTGVGKGSPAYSKIKTPDGWTAMGSIRLNDLVSTPDGSSAKVVGIYPQGVRSVYKVTLEDGRVAYCDDSHLWKVCFENSDAHDIISLKEIRGLARDIYIPIADPDFPDCTHSRIYSIEYIGEDETQCIMIDHPDHLYITDDYIVTHNTVAFIMSLQKLGKRALITMTSRLEQWVKEIQQYTTLEEDDLYVIQGLGSLTKLFKLIDDGIKPKIILASTATIRLYIEYRASYQHLPHPSEMCEKLGIGIIGTDEYHEHFHTNFLIGLMFNPKVFIPITATFMASDPFVKEIFNQFIPKDIQFVGGEYDRYVNVTAYTYRSAGHLLKPYQYTSRQGYSQQMFEKFLMSKKGKFVLDPLIQDAIIPIIRDHYINICDDGEKFLFLCASTKLCDYLEGVFKRAFNSKTVSVFYSGMPTTVLEKFDIIISTPGSAGCLTGDTLVSINRNGTNNNAGSYSCTLKNAYLHFNNLAKRTQYNWSKEIPTYTRSFNGRTIQLGEIGDIVYSGLKDVYKVTLANGLSIKCTPDHPIMTTDGWVLAKDIVNKRVMCETTRQPVKKKGRTKLKDIHLNVSIHHPYARKSTKSSKGRRYICYRLELHRAIYEAVVLNQMTLPEYREALRDPTKVRNMCFVDPAIYDIHHIDHDHSNNDPSNLTVMTKSEHKRLHSERSKFNFNQGIPEYSEAISIEYVGMEDTYDILCIDETHNFVANGIVVHNTGRDIKNLRTCFAFENTQSDIRNLQFIGRLRAFPAVKNTPEFVYISFAAIPQHVKYSNARAVLYGPRALSFKHRSIS